MADAPPELDSAPTAAMPRVRFTLADPTSWRSEAPRLFSGLNIAISACLIIPLGVLWLIPSILFIFSPVLVLSQVSSTMNPLWWLLSFALVIVGLISSFGYIWLLPLTNGGLYYRFVLGSLRRELPPQATDGFPVQITYSPRLHTGFRGWFDDADDIGVFYLERDGFHFVGDHSELRLRIDDVADVDTRASDSRSLWAAGDRTHITIDGLDSLQAVRLESAGDATVRGSHHANAALLEAVRTHLQTDPSQAAPVPGDAASQRQHPSSTVPDEYLPPLP